MNLRYLIKLIRIAKLAAAHPILFVILLKYRCHTMVPAIHYVHNLSLASRARKIDGAIVECGTWKGGMIAGIAEILGPKRSYYLYDSYEGLPPVTDLDGESAARWQSDVDSDLFHDNCLASEDDARTAMLMAGINHPNIIKGWFQDTLPHAKIPAGIALLRMDGDWYESTIQILRNMFPQVLPGGLIVIDDYYTWDGCSKAVHDFLSEGKRPERIRFYNGICYLEKAGS